MSNRCMNRVWELSKQRGMALFLLIAIADFADDNGFAFPRFDTLAAKIRMSKRQTIRIVANLEAAGELLVFKRHNRSNLYVVLAGTARERLAAALQRVTSFGVTVPPGTLEKVCTRLSPLDALPAAGGPQQLEDKGSSRGDNLSPQAPPQVSDCHPPAETLSPRGDILSPGSDTAMAPDPLGSLIDPSIERKWENTLVLLQGQMTKATFDRLLRGSRAVSLDGETLTVQVRYSHAVWWLETRLIPVVLRSLSLYVPCKAVRFIPPPDHNLTHAQPAVAPP